MHGPVASEESDAPPRILWRLLVIDSVDVRAANLIELPNVRFKGGRSSDKCQM